MFNNNLLMGAAAATSGTSLVSVGNSALFVSGNSEDLSRGSMSGTATTWTASFWVCRGDNGQLTSTDAKFMFTTASDAGLAFANNSTANVLAWYGGSYVATTRLFRDTAWYHMVVKNVAGTGTVYVNGESVLTGLTVPTADATMAIGSYNNSSSYLDGYMAEWVFIDGTALEPTSFAGYDSTGTFWTPLANETIKELTFGTNGFYLDNTTNAQTDASGESNSFTNNNTVLTVSSHTPTLIANLWNPLETFYNGGVFTNGNRTAQTGSSPYSPIQSTLGVISGKWYCEIVPTAGNGSSYQVGITKGKSTSNAQQLGSQANDVGYWAQTGKQFFNGTSGSSGATYGSNVTWTTNDVMGIALDLDSGTKTVTFYKNGASSGAIDISSLDLTTPYFIACGHYDNSSQGTFLLRTDSDDWTQSAPAGHKAINTTEIASATTRTKSNLEEYFSTTTYEGNGAGQRVGKFLPFTNSFTVANSALFNGTDNSLDRTQVAGTSAGTVWTFSAWIKKCENKNTVYVNWGTGGTQGQLGFDASGNFVIYDGSTTVGVASREFEDSSQWSHYHVAYDTGESGTDKVKLTINGVLITNWSTDNRSSANAFQNVGINGEVMRIGNNASAGSDAISLNGYMAQVVFLDGTASAASNFGQLDTSTGRWIPSDLSSFSFGSGNNTVFLDFADSDNLGDDESGQGHDFTNVNTVTQTADSPTVNIATLNSNDSAGGTISNGNKTLVTTGNSDQSTRATIRLPNTGKYYWELNLNIASASGATGVGHVMSLNNDGLPLTTGNGSWTDNVLLTQDGSGSVQIAQPSGVTALFTFSGTASINDKYQIAVDIDNHKLWFGINNSFFNSSGGTDGNPSTGANPTISQNFAGYVPMFGNFNTNQTVRFDSADWTYTQPTDYVSLTQDSLPTGESYQTAFSWIKNRDAADNHMLFDRVRGIYKDIHANDMVAQVTNVNTLQRFLNGGVQVGNDAEVNTASESYVAWNWYMETAGAGSSNTDGTINTTATLVDTNLGLSISQYTGTGSNATIGHGLGVVPELILLKNLDNTGSTQWLVYHSAIGNTKAAFLDANTAFSASAGYFNNTTPTSSVFSVGNSTYGNESSKNHVAYCFAPSQFTAIGSYKGNGNANGSFVPTVNSLGVPIQPAWVMIKRSDVANNWCMRDIVRDIDNPNEKELDADLPNAEITNSDLDIDTGGFKLRATDNLFNNSSGTYVYLAFGTPIIDVDGRIITGF
jgi:hypothetical protein